jgi:type II restriction/modification system DNA methylase subunit YeeA
MTSILQKPGQGGQIRNLKLSTRRGALHFGLDPALPLIGPESVLGIEVNPYAAELARVSVWIGHIQWARRNGYPLPADPVLQRLDTIECRDAILQPDGTVADWPVANAIVGNPPFLGGNRIRTVLGNTYCDRLFAAYEGQIPGDADPVCYWFLLADRAIVLRLADRIGLVSTNSIRGGTNRRVMEPIVSRAAITSAWPDEPWILDGASVRVSLVCWGRERAPLPLLDGSIVTVIHSDLSAGGANLTVARKLSENTATAFQGSKKVGPFEVPGDRAREWLGMPTNANGISNAAVLRPSWIAIDVVRRPRDVWIIDFTGRTEADASFFSAPFALIALVVKPLRENNAREMRRTRWWLHGDAQPRMRQAIAPLQRFIVTPEVSKHRLFVWAPSTVLPDCKLMVIAREDDTFFGILHSRFHESWALGTGSWHGVGNDPRYTPSTTFETFPFPAGLSPNTPAENYTDNAHAQGIGNAARALVQAREHWLNPPELVVHVPEVVAGFPERLVPKDDASAAILKKRTLTALYNTRGTPEGAWLDNLHKKLDAAVAAAYGWPADISEDDALARLLALNLSRPAA